MLVHFGIDSLEPEWRRSTVCIGTFDGVHLGHRAMISATIEAARTREEPSIIVTFDRHPMSVLNPEKRPAAIGTLEQNVIALREAGVSACVILPFSAELSRMPAQAFLDSILVEKLRAEHVVVGHDFAFGNGRQGTPEWLGERIDTIVVPKFLIDGARVSSTAIREAISSGNVGEAARFLGRPFALAGIVVPGEKLGRTLGYPTLNLARSSNCIIPADGVYAGLCRTPLGEYRAAISIGNRPAVNGKHRTVEAYLIDYPGNEIYGAPVQLSFVQRLRDELNFNSLDALKEQMARDVQTAAML